MSMGVSLLREESPFKRISYVNKVLRGEIRNSEGPLRWGKMDLGEAFVSVSLLGAKGANLSEGGRASGTVAQRLPKGEGKEGQSWRPQAEK